MTRILVTGCCGFIGSHIMHQLLHGDHLVIGIDDMSGGDIRNLPQGTLTTRMQFHEHDMGDYRYMKEIFMATKPEIIYHCASCAREGASVYSPRHITYTNVMISSLLLELAIQYGIKRIVHFSSMSVYGEQRIPFDETMKRKPVDWYGVNKAAIESMLEMLAEVHRFEYVILRAHNVFGENQNLIDPYRNVVGIFCNRIMREEPLYLYGEGHRRAFSYIGDSLPAFIEAGFAPADKVNKQIINVGGIHDTTIREMAEEVMKYFPNYPTPEIIVLPSRHAEVKAAFSTWEKSQKLLGYKEQYGWKEGIKRMAEWAKQRGPEPWKEDILPLLNDTAPETWRNLHQ